MLRHPPLALLSLDPSGDGEDYHAVNVTYREEWQRGEPIDPDFEVERMYRIQMARRLPQNLEFGDVLAAMLRTVAHLASQRDAGRIAEYVVNVETNGVGHGFASALRQKLGPRRVVGIFTTGGQDAKPVVEDRTTMPRMAALDHVRMLLELHYLRAAANAVGMDELAAELQTFVWRGKGRPEAMVGQHDDLVLALTLNVWSGEKLIPPLLRQQLAGPSRRVA